MYSKNVTNIHYKSVFIVNPLVVLSALKYISVAFYIKKQN